MTTPVGRPARGRSAAIAARQRLAEQEKARREATEKAIEGVWEAADAQDAAREALAAADADFRRHVDVLRAQGKSLDDIAELTGMPLADLRAARRGGAPSSDGDDGAEGDVTVPVPDPTPAKPAGARRAPRAGGEQGQGDGGSAAAADPAAGGAGGVGELSDEARQAAASLAADGGSAEST